MILAFADGNEALPCPDGLQFCRKTKRAVPQGQSGGEGLDIFFSGSAFMSGLVDLGNFFFRGDQPVQQVAVIGEQQQTFRSLVQPAHRL